MGKEVGFGGTAFSPKDTIHVGNIGSGRELEL